jgi:N-methylhydantoinase A/oxoprolinase/acetone carboxylase beta subunit
MAEQGGTLVTAQQSDGGGGTAEMLLRNSVMKPECAISKTCHRIASGCAAGVSGFLRLIGGNGNSWAFLNIQLAP